MAFIFNYQVPIKGKPNFFDQVLVQTGVANSVIFWGTLAI